VSPPGRPQVVVLDYGSGNLRSAQRALQRAGADVTVTADAGEALNCDGLVVPGVGAFAACIAGLRAIRGEVIIGKRLAGSRPVLGICVGMQVLFAEGAEHGERTAGCGELPGVVERLDAPVLPHMGWNTVRPPPGTRLLAGTGPDTRFYFVHSYAARSLPPRASDQGASAAGAGGQGAGTQGGRTSQPLLTLATHGQDFIAAVEDGPLCATQFHPEKSADAGAAVLANWLELIR
jgi:imidazole glycerol-phosphate synthase subunit HisH